MNAAVKCKKGEEILKYGSSVCKRGYFKTAKSTKTVTKNRCSNPNYIDTYDAKELV